MVALWNTGRGFGPYLVNVFNKELFGMINTLISAM
jgi:hypothetical protein